MERTKEIKERLNALLHPRLEQEIEKLEGVETEYFLHHMMLGIEQTIRHWRFKKGMKYVK